MLDRDQDDPAINDWLLALTEYCFDKSWHGSDAVGRFAGIHDFRLRKAIQFLEQRVCEPVELDSSRARGRPVAAPLLQAVPPAGWCHTNIYLNSLRMERAIDRLTGTNEAVAAIGLDLGFSSQASFSRFFIANGVVPPSAYRRSAQIAYSQ